MQACRPDSAHLRGEEDAPHAAAPAPAPQVPGSHVCLAIQGVGRACDLCLDRAPSPCALAFPRRVRASSVQAPALKSRNESSHSLRPGLTTWACFPAGWPGRSLGWQPLPGKTYQGLPASSKGHLRTNAGEAAELVPVASLRTTPPGSSLPLQAQKSPASQCVLPVAHPQKEKSEGPRCLGEMQDTTDLIRAGICASCALSPQLLSHPDQSNRRQAQGAEPQFFLPLLVLFPSLVSHKSFCSASPECLSQMPAHQVGCWMNLPDLQFRTTTDSKYSIVPFSLS